MSTKTQAWRAAFQLSGQDFGSGGEWSKVERTAGISARQWHYALLCFLGELIHERFIERFPPRSRSSAVDFATGRASVGSGWDERASVVMAIVVGVVATVITLGCVGWTAVNAMYRRKLEAELKRDMLDRGMSADEITKVIEAASPPVRWVRPPEG